MTFICNELLEQFNKFGESQSLFPWFFHCQGISFPSRAGQNVGSSVNVAFTHEPDMGLGGIVGDI